MTNPRKRPALGAVIFFGVAFALGTYFTFAAVQGDYGVFRRVQVDAEAETLQRQVEELTSQVAALENRTHRLSDDFLDLDLLDEQVRDVLGMIRTDEIVIR